MSKDPLFELSHLTNGLRDSGEPGMADWPLTDTQRAELQHPLDTDDPDSDEPWSTFRDRMLK